MKRIELKKIRSIIVFLALIIGSIGCDIFQEAIAPELNKLTRAADMLEGSYLRVEEITFNHNTISAVYDAINLRMNYSTAVLLPEYKYGRPKNFPAAYVGGTEASILVKFKSSDLSNFSAKIQGRSCDESGILGDTDIQEVVFFNGISTPVLFTIQGKTPYDVRSGDVTWSWNVVDDDTTKQIGTTTHRIYNLLAMPAAPWTQKWLDRKNPWANAIEVACGWMMKLRTTEGEPGDTELSVITTMTKGIYLYWGQSKAKVYSFDRNLGASHYTGRDKNNAYLFLGLVQFNFTQLLDPNTEYIDCTDVSAVVCLLSRILGADHVYIMHISVGLIPTQFWYKPIIPIGHDTWRGLQAYNDEDQANDDAWTGHQIVYYNGMIFDGCVTVNKNNPGYTLPILDSVPNDPMVPAGIPKDEYKKYLYWENLINNKQGPWFYGPKMLIDDIL